MINVCITHDIDRVRKTYQYFTKPIKALVRGDIRLFFKHIVAPFIQKAPYWGFDKIIDIENNLGVKSTCFFLNEKIRFKLFDLKTWKLALGRYSIFEKKVSDIIHFFDDNGWEIGLHGSYLSYNNYELLCQEKADLESIVGHEIIGIRQHYLNFDDCTWGIQQKAGFKYDSSWGYTNQIGFKDDKKYPFFPIPQSEFCEIPMIIMDSCFQNTDYKWQKLEEIVKEIDSVNGFLVINFHNNNLDELDFPEYLNNYIEIIKRLKEKGASFMTLDKAYNNVLHHNDKS